VDNYAARLFGLCTPVSAKVYGNPSEEVHAALAGCMTCSPMTNAR
jgi:hypothetical protein